MASIQYTVFPDSGNVAMGVIVSEEVVTVSGTHALSTVLPASQTRYSVRVFSDVDCFLTWGVTPVALADGSEGRMIGANNPEYFGVEPGQRFSVIERV